MVGKKARPRHAAGSGFCPDALHSPFAHANHGAGSKVMSFWLSWDLGATQLVL